MARWILLPKLGTNMESARIVGWLQPEGALVHAGTPVLEVETDKATYVVEAEAEGTLAALQAAPGDTVPISAPVAALLEHGEDAASLVPPAPAREQRADYVTRVRQAWRSARPPSSEAARMPMAPAARRIAQRAGVSPEILDWLLDTASVITAEEVERLVALPRAAIYGSGLGGKQILEAIRSRPGHLPVAFIDELPENQGTTVAGLPVLAADEALADEELAIAAVFLSFHSEARRRVFLSLRERDVALPPLVDARAAVAHQVEIGDAALVEAGAVVGPGTVIGENAIVDVGAVVAHDCAIGAHCHLSPGATLSGAVELDENVLVGVGAAVNSTVRIGRNSIVAPGSAVMNDVPADVVVSGVPATVIGESRRGA